MRKKNLFPIIMIMLSSLFCGCASTIPELSEKEQAYVTEYATNLLVKYSSVADRELLNEIQLEREMEEEAEQRERELKTQELANLYLQEEDSLQTNGKEENTESQETVGTAQKTVAEFFAEDGVTIDYASYQLCQSYPEGGDDFFMAMDATAGHQLCIVKFNVRNLSSTDYNLDMLGKKARFSIRIDGSTTISAQSTLLMDDLAAFNGTILNGETQELVLVFEVSDEISQVNTMDLIMRDETGENVVTLQ